MNVPNHIHWAMNLGAVSPSTARLLFGLPPSTGGGRTVPSEIDWHRFRVGTVVGSRVDGKIYQITGFDYSEQADIGHRENVRQNVELELEEEPTGRATPDWWIPNIHAPGAAMAYLKLDGHAYMVMVYGYEFQTMILKVELTRAAWADQNDLTPFQREIQAFRQSLTSSQ